MKSAPPPQQMTSGALGRYSKLANLTPLTPLFATKPGDEAYHAECFRCVQCESKIDDLVFAKTSQGIYCMKCHKERKEAKRQREERERMERAERMMEKLLPTIQEAEVRPMVMQH